MKKTISLQGRSLSYVDVGEGPVLLFGHSYLWDAAMWEAQVATLSGRFRCIVPELWGHGDSAAIEAGEAYSVEALTEDMAALLDALEVDRFSLLGLSVGGMWAARLAHRFPERVEKLVLMDCDLGEEPAESQARFLGMIQMVAQAQRFPEMLADACLPFFFGETTLRESGELVAAFRQSLLDWKADNIPTAMALGRGIFTRSDFMPQLAELRCPTLILCGEQDRSRPPEEAQRMHEAIQSSHLELIPDAGHIPSVEQPVLVTRLLLDFLV